jgi:hypothetical protein
MVKIAGFNRAYGRGMKLTILVGLMAYFIFKMKSQEACTVILCPFPSS